MGVTDELFTVAARVCTCASDDPQLVMSIDGSEIKVDHDLVVIHFDFSACLCWRIADGDSDIQIDTTTSRRRLRTNRR